MTQQAIDLLRILGSYRQLSMQQQQCIKQEQDYLMRSLEDERKSRERVIDSEERKVIGWADSKRKEGQMEFNKKTFTNLVQHQHQMRLL